MTSLIILALIITVLVIVGTTHSNMVDWGFPGVALVCYGVYLIPKLTILIYFHRYPLEEDAFDIPVEPEHWLGRVLFKMRRILDYVFAAVLVMLIYALSDAKVQKAIPLLYWTSAAIVIFYIFIALLPLLGIILLICSLPCVVVLLRCLYPEPNRGASDEAIKKLPLYEYKSSQCNFGPATIEPEDASCAICLQKYSERISLRVLGCRHHFHQRCADEWFKLQATCPLCVRPAVPLQGSDENA